MQWGTGAKYGLSTDQLLALSVTAPSSRVTMMSIQPTGLLWGFGESVQRKHFNQRLALKN